jgi:hypothetical protein
MTTCGKCTANNWEILPAAFDRESGGVKARSRCKGCGGVTWTTTIEYAKWSGGAYADFVAYIADKCEQKASQCPNCNAAITPEPVRGQQGAANVTPTDDIEGWNLNCTKCDQFKRVYIPRTLTGRAKTSVRYVVTAAIILVTGIAIVKLPQLAGWLKPGGEAMPPVVVVGSGTGAAFLRCKHLKTDVSANPPLVIVPGGTETGYSVLRESGSHGTRDENEVVIVGLSIDAPDHAALGSVSTRAPSIWIEAPIVQDYPLGVVVKGSVPALGKNEPCTIPGATSVTRCFRVETLQAFLESPQTSRDLLLVPDRNGGTRRKLDGLLGFDPITRPLGPYDKTDAFTMDYADINARSSVVAFGIPMTNSLTSSDKACEVPSGVSDFGICDPKSANACVPITLSLYAYTRAWPRVGAGQRASVPPSLCLLLERISRAIDEAAKRNPVWDEARCSYIVPSNGVAELPALGSPVDGGVE